MLRSDKFFPDDTFDKIEKDDRVSSSITLLPILRSDKFFPDDTFDKIEEDDPIWKDYVVAAQDYDKKMIEEWNKFLDVILVFVSASLLAWFISQE